MIFRLYLPNIFYKTLTLPKDIFKSEHWVANLGDFLPSAYYHCFSTLYYSWKVSVKVSIAMGITANAIIFMDLYLSLSNPFYPRAKRLPKYYLFMGFILIWTLLNSVYGVKAQALNNANVVPKWAKSSILQSRYYILLLAVFIIIPVILTVYRLSLKGTSEKLRKMVIRRHLIFASVYGLRVATIVYDRNYDKDKLYCIMKESCEGSKGWDYIALGFDILADSLGIFLALVRLMEPFVMREFMCKAKKLWSWLTCRKHRFKEFKLKYSEEPLCSFVNSAMNIEYVSVILLGITNLMENRKKMNLQAGKTSVLEEYLDRIENGIHLKNTK